ncbi:Leucine-rich repeat (LRR) family protein [Zea mays]|nr:Leucine-rich repeat (LRR) family protein [Zea mays]
MSTLVYLVTAKREKNVQYLDISFNNFTMGSSGPSQCLQGSVNLVESYSAEVNRLNSIHPCLKRNFPCVASNGQCKLISSIHS